jgi:hypothetical protein
LYQALAGISWPTAPEVLVGFDEADDAGVYKISEDRALVATTDFLLQLSMTLTTTGVLLRQTPFQTFTQWVRVHFLRSISYVFPASFRQTS